MIQKLISYKKYMKVMFLLPVGLMIWDYPRNMKMIK